MRLLSTSVNPPNATELCTQRGANGELCVCYKKLGREIKPGVCVGWGCRVLTRAAWAASVCRWPLSRREHRQTSSVALWEGAAAWGAPRAKALRRGHWEASVGRAEVERVNSLSTYYVPGPDGTPLWCMNFVPPKFTLPSEPQELKMGPYWKGGAGEDGIS